MAPTPFPRDYVYAGNAQVLTLKAAVVDGGGDLTLTVNEETATKGWPALGGSQIIVVVVARNTPYETKYAVKQINSSASGSTLIVDAADKTYDSTPVTSAPIGSTVEHCWSATEASIANDHFRTKQAHGSDGDIADVNSSQTLKNKTLDAPVIVNGASMSNTRLSNVADGVAATDAATKGQIDSAIPPGVVAPYAGAVAPSGWLMCSGQTVPRATYPALFAAIGTMYNTGGEGETEFRLPDLRSRVVVGAGQGTGNDSQGRPLSNRASNVKGGAETVKLTAAESGLPSHAHNINDTGHSHEQVVSAAIGNDGVIQRIDYNADGVGSRFLQGTNTQAAYTGISIQAQGPSDAATAHENMPPFLTLTYIIKK